MPKYPNIVVQLTGNDGNAFAIMGAVSRELKMAGVSDEGRASFLREAGSGDYNKLLQVCMNWVTVE